MNPKYLGSSVLPWTLSSLIGHPLSLHWARFQSFSNHRAALVVWDQTECWLVSVLKISLMSFQLILLCPFICHTSVNLEIIKNNRQEPSYLFWYSFMWEIIDWVKWITFQYSDGLLLLLLSTFYLLFKLPCLFQKHRAVLLCFFFGARQCRKANGIKLRDIHYPI